jgi:hypothetical protein
VPPLVAADCWFPVGTAALLADGAFARERYQQRAYRRAVFVHSSTMATDRLAVIARAVLASMGIPDDGTPRNGLDLIGTFYGPSFHVDDRNATTTGTVLSGT